MNEFIWVIILGRRSNLLIERGIIGINNNNLIGWVPSLLESCHIVLSIVGWTFGCNGLILILIGLVTEFMEVKFHQILDEVSHLFFIVLQLLCVDNVFFFKIGQEVFEILQCLFIFLDFLSYLFFWLVSVLDFLVCIIALTLFDVFTNEVYDFILWIHLTLCYLIWVIVFEDVISFELQLLGWNLLTILPLNELISPINSLRENQITFILFFNQIIAWIPLIVVHFLIILCCSTTPSLEVKIPLLVLRIILPIMSCSILQVITFLINKLLYLIT